jgi:hypothetical protein
MFHNSNIYGQGRGHAKIFNSWRLEDKTDLNPDLVPIQVYSYIGIYPDSQM